MTKSSSYRALVYLLLAYSSFRFFATTSSCSFASSPSLLHLLQVLYFNHSNLSYMEHLLRDGGDLDSMDRSLLDYNHHSSNKNTNPTIVTTSHNGNGADSPPLPDPPTQYNDNKAAINVSPATPLPTPISSPEGVTVMPVIKRDLVVRFTEQQNSVRCEMAAGAGGGGVKRRGQENHAAATTAAFKDQYYQYHGPTSPCDSESSACNRSQENLIAQGKEFLNAMLLNGRFFNHEESHGFSGLPLTYQTQEAFYLVYSHRCLRESLFNVIVCIRSLGPWEVVVGDSMGI